MGSRDILNQRGNTALLVASDAEPVGEEISLSTATISQGGLAAHVREGLSSMSELLSAEEGLVVTSSSELFVALGENLGNTLVVSPVSLSKELTRAFQEGASLAQSDGSPRLLEEAIDNFVTLIGVHDKGREEGPS